MVKYHGLARRYLTAPGFLMRPQLNSGTLGGRGNKHLRGPGAWRGRDLSSGLSASSAPFARGNFATIMWRHDTVPGYVSDVSDGRITVSGAWSTAPSCTCPEAPHISDAAGRLPQCDGDQALVEALNCLVDRGFMLMNWGHSWPPARAADDLRQRGFAVHAFRIVTFDGAWFQAIDPSGSGTLRE